MHWLRRLVQALRRVVGPWERPVRAWDSLHVLQQRCLLAPEPSPSPPLPTRPPVSLAPSTHVSLETAVGQSGGLVPSRGDGDAACPVRRVRGPGLLVDLGGLAAAAMAKDEDGGRAGFVQQVLEVDAKCQHGIAGGLGLNPEPPEILAIQRLRLTRADPFGQRGGSAGKTDHGRRPPAVVPVASRDLGRASGDRGEGSEGRVGVASPSRSWAIERGWRGGTSQPLRVVA